MKLESLWYDSSPLSLALIPFSWIFCTAVKLRRLAYHYRLLPSYRLPVPVVVAGNITVGGAGKTPLVIWLARFLQQAGFKPGIVSRGYKGRAKTWPQAVTPDSDPLLVGDEPVLLARHTGCPVVVAPNRVAAARYLLEHHACDILLSDDGLQHYALQRDLEIALVDDIRRFGNGYCLPAGPLREPEERLKEVAFVVTKGATMPHETCMKYHLRELRGVGDAELSKPLVGLRGQTIHALAGIADPERFFARLEEQGIKVKRHPFPDHHVFCAEDIRFEDNLPVVMTEKDAVKCRAIADQRHWYLPIEVHLPQQFGEEVLKRLNLHRESENGQKTA
jgi:tetraacyldisaccharide 4'-kinase